MKYTGFSAEFTCRHKKRFSSRAKAVQFSKLMTSRGDFRVRAKTPYRCPVCRKWHLTSREPDDNNTNDRSNNQTGNRTPAS